MLILTLRNNYEYFFLPYHFFRSLSKSSWPKSCWLQKYEKLLHIIPLISPSLGSHQATLELLPRETNELNFHPLENFVGRGSETQLQLFKCVKIIDKRAPDKTLIVYDAGPTLIKDWIRVPCLPGWDAHCNQGY